MKIKVIWEVSISKGSVNFDLEDMNCSSEKEWRELSEAEKEERIQEALDTLPNEVCLLLNEYED